MRSAVVRFLGLTLALAATAFAHPAFALYVHIIAPDDGTVYTAPAAVQITAVAYPASYLHPIVKVEFFQGETLIGTSTTEPYGITWSNVPAGSYSIIAKVTDSAGDSEETGDTTDITVSSSGPQTAQIYYIVPDHLNTPRAVYDQQQRNVWRWERQEPFGASLPNDDPEGDGITFVFDLRFPGQYFDRETFAYHNYFRDYDPATGRYLQTDPLVSHGLSPYPYARVNPLRFEDRFGLEPRDPSDVLLLCAADMNPDDGRKVPRVPKTMCDSQDDCVAKCRCRQIADLASCYARGGSLNIPCQFRAKEQLEACLQGCAAKG